MSEAYIVDALRSPTGKRRGALKDVHPVDLGAHALKALVDRNNIPAEDYDDVIFGCLDTVGPQAGDIARTSWLTAGLPQTVPGVTIDRQCGSSQQAVLQLPPTVHAVVKRRHPTLSKRVQRQLFLPAWP